MQSSYTHIQTMQYESAKIFFHQILVFMTVMSNLPNFLPAKFSRYTVDKNSIHVHYWTFNEAHKVHYKILKYITHIVGSW